MKIAIASDHGGYELKESITRHLKLSGHEVADFGTSGTRSVDYPYYGAQAARAVARGECERGIVICKSGIGMSIVANKIRGVRAALCLDEEMAALSRRHNDANVLVLAGSRTSPQQGEGIVDLWLVTPCEGGRHGRRVAMIEDIEKSQIPNPKSRTRENKRKNSNGR
ncbi:MAG: ribose 5-phosphate isomerase B [Candidatus Aureabacteria bacterium]|nr:ribose 5-phosphate isomerase B [Candidatus Auribacterota bacterium]